jgi:hypothetical protein
MSDLEIEIAKLSEIPRALAEAMMRLAQQQQHLDSLVRRLMGSIDAHEVAIALLTLDVGGITADPKGHVHDFAERLRTTRVPTREADEDMKAELDALAVVLLRASDR